MNLPWSVWTALACGVMLIAWPGRSRATWLSWLAVTVVGAVWLAELLVYVMAPVSDEQSFRVAGLVLALLWSVGLGGDIVAAHGRAGWGWICLTAAALEITAAAPDWLTLGLAWEIVQRTAAAMTDLPSHTNRSRQREALGPSLGFWTAVAAWLFATGSLHLEDIAIVLQRSYAAREPDVSLGRPSLVVTAAACLTVVSVLGPCFFRANRDVSHEPGLPLAAVFARQMTAVLLLARCCRDVFIGIEAPVSWVLLVFAAGTWLLAVRTVVQTSPLDRLWFGCSQVSLAVVLTWLLVVLVERTAIAGGLPAWRGLGFATCGAIGEMAHSVVALSGANAAVRWISRAQVRACYLEELQGAARDRPWWGALVLVPIGSLMGVPGLIGSRLRFLVYVALWSLPQAGPGDLLTVHSGLMALVWISWAGWVLTASACLSVFRTLLWDLPLGTWTIRKDWWSASVAVAAMAALVLFAWMLPGQFGFG